MAAYPASRSALGWILPEASDLDRSSVCARQGARCPRDCRNNRLRCRHSPEIDDARADAELDAGHATAGAALWPYGGGWEVQELGVIGDKDQLGRGSGEFDGAHDPVAGLEADDFPGIFAEDLGIDPLDDTTSRAKREAE